MTNVFRAMLFCLAATFAQVAGSFTIGSTNTYVNLRWSFSAPGTMFGGCDQIVADAVGDLTNSNRVVVYGTLNCPASNAGLPITGAAYIGDDGTFNLTVNVATLASISCNRLSRLTGPCNITSSSGANIGSGYISFY